MLQNRQLDQYGEKDGMMKTLAPAGATALLLTPCLSVAQAAAGDETGEEWIEEIVTYGRETSLVGESRAASEGIVGYDDIRLPPLLRVGELVESVPGMVATQHSGTGKANQYFIRGFNLDHGTDFAVSVEGVPINLRTNGHGQGYLDLNFLIPELVETTSYRRGPYSAEVGDFGTAASVDFKLYDTLPGPVLSATAGEDGYWRALAAGSLQTSMGSFTGAVDATRYDGPWELDEDLQQYKFYAAWMFDLAGGSASISAQGYDGEWTSTDQIPLRAVAAGLIDRLGYIDPDLGGETQRYALTAALDFDSWRATAYAIDYDFRLYSNFTYALDDPLTGDEFEQDDERRIYGLRIDGDSLLGRGERDVILRWGGEFRLDDISEVGLYGTEGRVRNEIVRQDSVDELSVAAWAEADYRFNDRLRFFGGLRADWYEWDVDAFRTENSGTGNESILSPGAGLAYRLGDGAEAYVNWGRGFHSNDVRGTTIEVDPVTGEPSDPVEALVASEGAEVGLRVERGTGFNATFVIFWLELDSELVYVGDAGNTEPNDATERVGFEATAFWRPTEWLALHAAYTTTNAEFATDQGGGREIPGAVESTFTTGVNANWANGLFASARLRWLSEAPLTEDGSVRSDESLLVNAGLGYRSGRFEYRLDVFNLFDSDDADISYYYASRLPGEAAEGVEDIHFHPLEPRTIRASVSFRWR
ncbi:MAG: TonB-dependent receptor [Gammaproteobacteria bacterium]